MQKPKSKITAALTAIYCAVVGAGVIWQNVETGGTELAANILDAENSNSTAVVQSTTVRRVAYSNDVPNHETDQDSIAQMGMSPETRAKIKEGAAEINESVEDLREIMSEAEWCMNNKLECASEKIDLPPKLQEMANKLKEAEEYAKYMQAIPMIVQSKIAAVQAEITAEIARIKFLAKNEVPLTDDTLGAVDKLEKKVDDAKETAEAATGQLSDACGEDCGGEEVEDDPPSEVAMRNIPTRNNPPKNNSNSTMIARNSGENKVVVSTPRENNSPLSASILSVNSVKTSPTTNGSSTNTSRKIAIVTTSDPEIGSEYAEILAKLEALESDLDEVGGGLDELAEKTTEKMEEGNQKMKDDFAEKQEENAQALADAQKEVDDFEPPEIKDEKEPTAIGFWNRDADGNKIHSGYGDVVPIRPVSSDSHFQPDNSFVLPTWNYNEYEPIVDSEI